MWCTHTLLSSWNECWLRRWHLVQIHIRPSPHSPLETSMSSFLEVLCISLSMQGLVYSPCILSSSFCCIAVLDAQLSFFALWRLLSPLPQISLRIDTTYYGNERKQHTIKIILSKWLWSHCLIRRCPYFVKAVTSWAIQMMILKSLLGCRMRMVGSNFQWTSSCPTLPASCRSCLPPSAYQTRHRTSTWWDVWWGWSASVVQR